MAKSKKSVVGTATKREPEAGDIYEAVDDKLEMRTVHVLHRDGDEFECDVYDAEGKEGHKVLRLKDFTQLRLKESGPVPNDSSADDKPKMHYLLQPTKKGMEIVCPGVTCKDRHPLEDTLTEDEFLAKMAAFKGRHDPHVYEGSLFQDR